MMTPPVRNQILAWRPDLADHRDYSRDTVEALLRRLKVRTRRSDLPAQTDWHEYSGPVEDQAEWPTGTAHACMALVQQIERRASGRLLRLSSLFGHQVACRVQGTTTESAVSVRTMLKTIVRCGVPPEKYWPYDSSHWSREPDAFTYSFARGFRAFRYMRLDSAGASGGETLDRLRSFLAAGLPFVCGFPVCTAVGDAAEIPFPTLSDSILGGQAVVAVGYDDKQRVRSDKGALLVRNSWGRRVGRRGLWLAAVFLRSAAPGN
jgi:C1A family cysteine protease